MDVDSGTEEGAVEALLVKLGREIHTMVGVKMYRLGVFEWEVKLRIASSGKANGAWRVVVTNVTGHTCIVHVSNNGHLRYFKNCQTHFTLSPSLQFLFRCTGNWRILVYTR